MEKHISYARFVADKHLLKEETIEKNLVMHFVQGVR